MRCLGDGNMHTPSCGAAKAGQPMRCPHVDSTYRSIVTAPLKPPSPLSAPTHLDIDDLGVVAAHVLHIAVLLAAAAARTHTCSGAVARSQAGGYLSG